MKSVDAIVTLRERFPTLENLVSQPDDKDDFDTSAIVGNGYIRETTSKRREQASVPKTHARSRETSFR